MKKITKIWKKILLAVVALIIVILLAVTLFGNMALKVGIEKGATSALNVGVKVGRINLSILRGTLAIGNLQVDNPPGYEHPRLLELGKGKVAVSIGSLLSDTVRIKEIRLDGIEFVLEQKGMSNNVQDIINSISSREKEEKEAKVPAEPSGKKLYIDELEITNVTVKAKLLPVPGKADTVTLKLAPIRMNDLGKDGAMDMAKLSSKILLAIAQGVAQQGAGILPKDLTATMDSTLDKAFELTGTATEKGKEAIEKGKDLGKEISEGLKGLFKPKEEDK